MEETDTFVLTKAFNLIPTTMSAPRVRWHYCRCESRFPGLSSRNKVIFYKQSFHEVLRIYVQLKNDAHKCVTNPFDRISSVKFRIGTIHF